MSGRKLGIVIATNEYSDIKIRNLRFAEKDAKDVKDILLNTDICGFDKVVEVINEHSTDSLGEIEQLFDEAERDDLILIYFSGHGELDKQNELCLLFKNTKIGRLLATSINYSMIKKCINGSRCQTTVVILDCCYSGAATIKGNNISDILDKTVGIVGNNSNNISSSGTVILSASSEFDVAKEDEKLENSVFTHYFVEGLKSGIVAGDSNGDISLDDLYYYVNEKVTKYLQTPYRKFDCKGKIIIGKNPLKVKENSYITKRNKLVEIYEDGSLPDDVYDISMTVLNEAFEKSNELSKSREKVSIHLESFLEGKIGVKTYISTIQCNINAEKEAIKQKLKEEEEKRQREDAERKPREEDEQQEDHSIPKRLKGYNKNKLNVLLFEPKMEDYVRKLAEYFKHFFFIAGYQSEITCIYNEEDLKKQLDNMIVDVVISELSFSSEGFAGLFVIQYIKKNYPDIFCIGTSAIDISYRDTNIVFPTFDMFIDKFSLLENRLNVIVDTFLSKFKNY